MYGWVSSLFYIIFVQARLCSQHTPRRTSQERLDRQTTNNYVILHSYLLIYVRKRWKGLYLIILKSWKGFLSNNHKSWAVAAKKHLGKILQKNEGLLLETNASLPLLAELNEKVPSVQICQSLKIPMWSFFLRIEQGWRSRTAAYRVTWKRKTDPMSCFLLEEQLKKVNLMNYLPQKNTYVK